MWCSLLNVYSKEREVVLRRRSREERTAMDEGEERKERGKGEGGEEGGTEEGLEKRERVEGEKEHYLEMKKKASKRAKRGKKQRE